MTLTSSSSPKVVQGFVPKGRVVVVTGAAGGIGAALARRFVQDGAAAVIAADQDADRAQRVAKEMGAHPLVCDLSTESGTRQLIETTESRFGPIDLFCANAGIAVKGTEQLADDVWARMWQINVMAHVHAARLLVPRMLARGSGHFLVTASASGLLSNFDAPYAVTKHAAVAFAEWLAIEYGNRGIGVSCICPAGVDTAMFRAESERRQHLMSLQVLTAEDVAAAAIKGLADGKFLILPHAEIGEFFQMRANDHQRWLKGMRGLHSKAHAPESLA